MCEKLWDGGKGGSERAYAYAHCGPANTRLLPHTTGCIIQMRRLSLLIARNNHLPRTPETLPRNHVQDCEFKGLTHSAILVYKVGYKIFHL